MAYPERRKLGDLQAFSHIFRHRFLKQCQAAVLQCSKIINSQAVDTKSVPLFAGWLEIAALFLLKLFLLILNLNPFFSMWAAYCNISENEISLFYLLWLIQGLNYIGVSYFLYYIQDCLVRNYLLHNTWKSFSFFPEKSEELQWWKHTYMSFGENTPMIYVFSSLFISFRYQHESIPSPLVTGVLCTQWHQRT